MSDEKVRLFGDYALDTVRGCLLRGTTAVHLRPQAYEMLTCLAANRGRLVGKDQLIQTVWHGRAVGDDSLVQCLRDVRVALGDRDGHVVRTVRGRGYIFDPADGPDIASGLPDVERRRDAVVTSGRDEGDLTEDLVGLPPAAISGTTAAMRVWSTPRQLRPAAALLAVTLLTLGAATLISGIGHYFRGPSAPSRPVGVTDIRSLAVLPFRAVVPELRDEALEMGMADTIITKLSGLSAMEVRPLGAVRRYRDQAQDPVRAGREMGVDAVLEGSFQRSGGRVRVTARLVGVADGRQLWADRFDEDFRDIFTVQDSISERVTSELALTLTGEERQRLTKRHTENVRAYQSYLQGRLHAQRLTREDLLAASRYYQRAIEEDSNYALAYAGLADVHTNLASRGYVAFDTARRQAEAAARRALSLDEQLAEAHAAVGQIHIFSAPYDFTAGDRALRRAIALSPSLALAHHFLAVSLMEQGRLDEALERWTKARNIDPLSPRIARAFAYTHLLKGDSARAMELLLQAQDLGPAFVMSPEVEIYISNGRLTEALSELEKIGTGRAADPTRLYSRGMVYAAQGRREDALRVIKQLEQPESGQNLALAHLIARIHATLGEEEAALSWLRRGLDVGSIALFYKDSSVWDGLRGEPSFQELLRRMGISPEQ